MQSRMEKQNLWSIPLAMYIKVVLDLTWDFESQSDNDQVKTMLAGTFA
jgi:hypothetical protein